MVLNRVHLVFYKVAVICALLVVIAALTPASSKPVQRTTISSEELTRAASAAADYLASQIKADGSFVYLVNLNPKIKIKPKYNWLRHAGTLYSLADFLTLHKRQNISAKLRSGVVHMRRFSLAPVDEFPTSYAIWTKPGETGYNGPLTAKLGGAGLALVAMTSLQRHMPGSVPKEELSGLGRFIVELQKTNGSFYSRYTPSRGGRDDSWESLFYPGEAALGLTMLYELDGNKTWLTAARNTLQFLSQSRKGATKVPVDHWALIATKRLWTHLDENDRTTFKRHARQIIDEILQDQIWKKSLIFGSFSRRGLTTGTATRLEGLLATEFLFRDDPEYYSRIRTSMSWGIKFLLRAQLTKGKYRGAIPRAIARIKGSSRRILAFNRRAKEVRIDYVQHALSAFVGYSKLLKEVGD